MEKLVINGKTHLKGDVTISGAKNAAVAILPATLLIDGICTIDNLPNISDVQIQCEILKDMDDYYTALLDKPAVLLPGHTDTCARVSPSTVIRIHKLLKSAFAKAVAWDYIENNPKKYA